MATFSHFLAYFQRLGCISVSFHKIFKLNIPGSQIFFPLTGWVNCLAVAGSATLAGGKGFLISTTYGVSSLYFKVKMYITCLKTDLRSPH